MPKELKTMELTNQYPSKRIARISLMAWRGYTENKKAAAMVKNKDFAHLFYNRYYPLIDYVDMMTDKYMPTGFAAAVIRAFLWYKNNQKDVLDFLLSIKNCNFTGPDDPAHQYLLWANRSVRKGKVFKWDSYLRAVFCIRRYIVMRLGKKYSNRVRNRTKDFFYWGDCEGTSMVKENSQISIETPSPMSVLEVINEYKNKK